MASEVEAPAVTSETDPKTSAGATISTPEAGPTPWWRRRLRFWRRARTTQETPASPEGDTGTATTGDGVAKTSTSTATTGDETTDADTTGDTETVDPWDAFTPIVPEGPRWIARATDRVFTFADRIVRHEWTLASAGCCLLAATMTWPVLRHPATALPDNLQESAPEALRLAWAGHSLITDPTGFFSGNILHRDAGIIPMATRLIGYTPAGLIGTGDTAAIVRYNILFVLSFALAAFGGYVLVRQLGGRRLGAVVAAVAFAFGPWKLGQAAHLDAQSVGGVALAFAMLARGHGWSLRHGRRPERGNAAWTMAGWAVAAWQISLGVEIGLPFAYILTTVVLIMIARWVIRKGRPRPRLLTLLAGLFGIIVTGASAVSVTLLALHTSGGQKATIDHATAAASIPLRGFVTAPEQSLLWGGLHDPARAALTNADQMAMLPGFFLLALAITGLIVSVWPWQHRLLMFIGIGVVGVLSMGFLGPEGGWFGYRSLVDLVPGFDAVRSPNRLLIWAVLLVVLLAAGAVDALSNRATLVLARLRRIERIMVLRPITTTDPTTGRVTVRIRGARRRAITRFAMRIAVLLPLVLVTAEALPRFSTPSVEAIPASFDKIRTPAIVLPTGGDEDAAAMLWSASGFPLIANQSGQPTPDRIARARAAAKRFPDAESIAAFTDLGVTTVVVLRSPASKAGYAVGTGDVDGYLVQQFNLVVEESEDVLVFTLPAR